MTGNNRKKEVWLTISAYAQTLFGALFLALLIRGFIFEPFRIPSKSMVPTLLVGDHIFVARFKYGLRVPLTKYWLAEFEDPKRGDVVVFTFPKDDHLDYIKRVVGVPGDVVAMKDGVLSVNGQVIAPSDLEVTGPDPKDSHYLAFAQESLEKLSEPLKKQFPNYQNYQNYQIQLEDLFGYSHFIQRSKISPDNENFEVTVPERSFFCMGDNRDMSQDSRFWGFVPREYLKGKAIFIWLSLDNERGGVRWNRFGKRII